MYIFSWCISPELQRLCSLVVRLSVMLVSSAGVFIICWLPFFLTHVLKAHCGSCCISPSLYSAVTWLGYLNSAVNPVIYTTFNIEFRKAFIKLLHCWQTAGGLNKTSSTWWQRQKALFVELFVWNQVLQYCDIHVCSRRLLCSCLNPYYFSFLWNTIMMFLSEHDHKCRGILTYFLEITKSVNVAVLTLCCLFVFATQFWLYISQLLLCLAILKFTQF